MSPPFIAALGDSAAWVEPLAQAAVSPIRIEVFDSVEQALGASERPDLLLCERGAAIPGVTAVRAGPTVDPGRVQDILQLAEIAARARIQAQEAALATSRLRRYQEWSAAAERAFAALLHELRTPVAVAQGFMANLRDDIHGPLPPEAHLAAERGAAAALHLANLLGQAKLPPAPGREAKGEARSSQRRRIDLAALVQEAAGLLAGEAERLGVRISAETGAEVPKIWANAPGVLQVLVNLLSNALRHTPRGESIRLSLAKDGSGGPGTRAVLRVIDSGRGIPAELRPQIFERGVSGDGRSGLGLAISKEIAEEHGGSLTLEDQAQGTAFRLELPADPRERRPEHKLRFIDDPDLSLELLAALKSRGLALSVGPVEVDELAARVLLGQESVILSGVEPARVERLWAHGVGP